MAYLTNTIAERYRGYDTDLPTPALVGPEGFFRFGDLTCFGQTASGVVAKSADVLARVSADSAAIWPPPFDVDRVIDNLRLERYAKASAGAGITARWTKDLYYFIRPLLSDSFRAPLQRYYLRSFETLPFPNWPVDCTADRLCETVLAMSMRSAGLTEVPFIWFWPNGARAAIIMTHDVETEEGLNFCERLMDLNDSAAVPASFQLVPEGRYQIPDRVVDHIRGRGNEINIQDLNHDGRLFRDFATFHSRVKSINTYGRKFGAKGFRSAVLYRNPDWFNELEFEYDMSVPNAGHLEAQRGGCCTVFPYFIGDLLELPVTTTQDYSLFRVLGDFSLSVWKRQIETILQHHGLLTFIVHPDYLVGAREQAVYQSLLECLATLRADGKVWVARPGEVNAWWRIRAAMTLRREVGGWRILGDGHERAWVAYAVREGDTLTYRVA